jgi:hypothetical protein
MPVHWTKINHAIPLPNPIMLIRNNLQIALRGYEICTIDKPEIDGYEDYLRKFVGQYFITHVPMLKNLHNEGPRVYYNDKSFYRPDMLIGCENINYPFPLKFKTSEGEFKLKSFCEWGHEHANGIKGVINKPIADFLKWFILFDSAGKFKYTPLPFCCFQIVTDHSGKNIAEIEKIKHIYNTLGFLTDIWKIEYQPHLVQAYVFMNFFGRGMTFQNILGGKIDQFYIDDLMKNYNNYYHQNKSWPLKYSVKNGVSALEALINI